MNDENVGVPQEPKTPESPMPETEAVVAEPEPAEEAYVADEVAGEQAEPAPEAPEPAGAYAAAEPVTPAEPPAPPAQTQAAPPAPPQPVAPPPPPAPSAPQYAQPAAPAPVVTSTDKNKIVAGVLAILLGSLGIHKFYLGYTKEGIILLVVSLVSFGLLAWVTSIVGIVEGVIYLTKTDEDFYATYVAGRKSWF